MKKVSILVASMFVLLLAGCGSSGQQISFENFQMNIEENYKEITDSSIIENKQITNKILSAYKYEIEQDTEVSTEKQFKDNIVITKSILKKDLTLDQLVSVNEGKLQQELIGFTKTDEGIIDFDCKETTINGYYNKFYVSDNILDSSSKKQYLSQFYFKNGLKNYIISFATEKSSNVNGFIDSLKTLTCK